MFALLRVGPILRASVVTAGQLGSGPGLGLRHSSSRAAKKHKAAVKKHKAAVKAFKAAAKVLQASKLTAISARAAAGRSSPTPNKKSPNPSSFEDNLRLPELPTAIHPTVLSLFPEFANYIVPSPTPGGITARWKRDGVPPKHHVEMTMSTIDYLIRRIADPTVPYGEYRDMGWQEMVNAQYEQETERQRRRNRIRRICRNGLLKGWLDLK